MVAFPKAGEQFGRYVIERILGQGGMGVVYEATDTQLHRAVALKIVQPSLAVGEEFKERFEREANTLARLRSRNIVQIMEYGEVEGTVYLVTEFVPDGDLFGWLRTKGPLEPLKALELMAPICEALDDAHRAGVVHRDVKPSNVLLWERTQGELVPYLCDFGIATDGDGGQTKTGSVVGSLAYMSPERHLGQPATAQGDIYSAGCVLWACLTGKPPYAGTDFQLMTAHLNEPLPQLPPTAPGAAVINPILERSLAKEPTARYPSAGEFGKAIDHAIDRLEAGGRTNTSARPVIAPTTPPASGGSGAHQLPPPGSLRPAQGKKDLAAFPPPIGRKPLDAPPPAAAVQPSAVARPADTGNHQPTHLAGGPATPPPSAPGVPASDAPSNPGSKPGLQTPGTPPGGSPTPPPTAPPGAPATAPTAARPTPPSGPSGPTAPGPRSPSGGPTPPASPANAWMSGQPQPPARRRRPGLIIGAVAAAIVLIAGGISLWAYTSGKFGVGPLSGDDKEAAAALAAAAPAPSWADKDAVSCASDKLLHHTRASDLQKAGILTKNSNADHGWDYTHHWDGSNATTYMSALLDCADDWEGKVADDWKLESSSCLHDIGAGDFAGYFAEELLHPSDDSAAAKAKESTVSHLDDCYAKAPTAPQGTASAAYRAVKFSFARPKAANGEVQLKVRDGSEWRTVSGSSYTLSTQQGGDHGCVTARTVAQYGWGTTKTADQKVCGNAKPASIWWTKDSACASKWQSYYHGACNSWTLHYRGLQPFKSYQVTFKQNGGACGAVSGNCTLNPTVVSSDGRGSWMAAWSAPAGWHEHFTATIGKMVAVLPN